MSSLYDHLKKLEDKKGRENVLSNLQEAYSSDRKRTKIPFLLSILFVVFLIFSASITLFFYPDLLNNFANKKTEVVKLKKFEPPAQTESKYQETAEKQIKKSEKSANNNQLVAIKPEIEKNVEDINRLDLAETKTTEKNETIKEQPTPEISTKENNIIAEKKDEALVKAAIIEEKAEKTAKVNEVPDIPKDTEKLASVNKEEKKITESKKTVLENTSAEDERIERLTRKKRLLEQAENLRAKKDFKGASEIYERVWNEYQDTNVANNLGASLIMLGNYRKALLIFEQALRIKPDDEELLFNYNFLKDKTGKE